MKLPVEGGRVMTKESRTSQEGMTFDDFAAELRDHGLLKDDDKIIRGPLPASYFKEAVEVPRRDPVDNWVNEAFKPIQDRFIEFCQTRMREDSYRSLERSHKVRGWLIVFAWSVIILHMIGHLYK